MYKDKDAVEALFVGGRLVTKPCPIWDSPEYLEYSLIRYRLGTKKLLGTHTFNLPLYRVSKIDGLSMTDNEWHWIVLPKEHHPIILSPSKVHRDPALRLMHLSFSTVMIETIKTSFERDVDGNLCEKNIWLDEYNFLPNPENLLDWMDSLPSHMKMPCNMKQARAIQFAKSYEHYSKQFRYVHGFLRLISSHLELTFGTR